MGIKQCTHKDLWIFNFNPWLVIKLNSDSNSIVVGSNSKIVLNLRYNSRGSDTSKLYPGKYVIDGTPVGFTTDSKGFVIPILTVTKNGLSTTTFTSRRTGTSIIKSSINFQTVTTSVKIFAKLYVTSTDPVNNAFRVPINKLIKITFNVPIKYGNKFIKLINKWGSKPFRTYISGSSLYIKPLTVLAKGVQYTVILHTGSIQALSGSSKISLFRFKFTTTK
ncbi:MAG: Ig-like domain-containing protein [Methanobacterium sp. ERen5]|nr:MAG: Ig-like domain-containing protein [Methanobacterium sp. ERen5]